MRTPRRSPRSAAGSTACRSPSSSPRRASRCWASKALPNAWTTASSYWGHDAARPCRGIGPCGPWSIGATACSAKTSDSAIDRLADLVAKSLVVVDVSGAKPRFRLLDTTRAYTIEKLDSSGERERTARRHAVYYRNLFERAETDAPTRTASEWLGDYAPEIDNLRAALDWAFSAHGDQTIGVALAAASLPLWIHLSLLDECRSRAKQALGSLGAETRDSREEMRLHAALGTS